MNSELLLAVSVLTVTLVPVKLPVTSPVVGPTTDPITLPFNVPVKHAAVTPVAVRPHASIESTQIVLADTTPPLIDATPSVTVLAVKEFDTTTFVPVIFP